MPARLTSTFTSTSTGDPNPLFSWGAHGCLARSRSVQTLPFDPYKELEVDLAASPETIDAAWKALLKRHHPDRAQDPPVALAKAKRLNQAHDFLADPARRAAYDLERIRRARAPEPPTASNPAGPGATRPRPSQSATPGPAATEAAGSAETRRSSTRHDGPAPSPRLAADLVTDAERLKQTFARIMGSRFVAIVGVLAAMLWLRVALTYYSSDELDNDIFAVFFAVVGGGLAYARGLGALGWSIACAILPPAVVYLVAAPYLWRRAEPVAPTLS